MALKKEKAVPASSKLAKSGGEKQTNKKWSKGKQKEKVNNMVLLDQATYDKLLSEAPKFKLNTQSILSDHLRINGSEEGNQGFDGLWLDQDGHCTRKPADLQQGNQHLGLLF